jgi:hypothetical protein
MARIHSSVRRVRRAHRSVRRLELVGHSDPIGGTLLVAFVMFTPVSRAPTHAGLLMIAVRNRALTPRRADRLCDRLDCNEQEPSRESWQYSIGLDEGIGEFS